MKHTWSIGRLIQPLVTFTTFVVLATVVLLLANGYSLSRATWRIERTAVISLDGLPRKALVQLDGTTVSHKLPTTVRFVSLGNHDIQVSAPGYHSWRQSVRFQPGDALVNTVIRLWLDPAVEGAPSEVTATLQTTPLVSDGLTIVGNELYRVERSIPRLITRFSSPLGSAVLSGDRSHVVVQSGREVVAMELTGANTTKLFTLQSDTPTPLLLNSDDSQLTVIDVGLAQTWQIR